MYWMDSAAAKLQRSNLDGSNVEDLIAIPARPSFLALDSLGGKVYWTESNTDRIRRANLDGSNVEDLVTGEIVAPFGIALDGSNVEDLITSGLSHPYFITLDVSGGKIYWTDSGTDKIQRADLDGSDVEELVTSGLSLPRGIALNVSNGKMYWAHSFPEKIQRANLDGTNVEDLVTSGLAGPVGIALYLQASTPTPVPGVSYWALAVTAALMILTFGWWSRCEQPLQQRLAHHSGRFASLPRNQ